MDRLTFAATGSLDGNTLSGVAHTYGTRTLRGGRYIQFAQGAFRYSDVRSFWNHDTRLLLGRQSSGTVQIEDQPDGLHYSIDLPDTSYAADLKALVARGDLTEMSFGVMPGEKRVEKAGDGKPIDVYLSADLFDISPVSMPAFTSGTSIQLHSMEHPMNLSETLAAMEALQPPEGESMSDEAIAQYKAYEADVARFNESDNIRSRFADLKKPIVGMPAVIRATPKGDAGLDFAFDQYLRSGQPNADLQTFAQTVGSDAGGGYAVPQGFLNRLTEARTAWGGFMNKAENITTTTGIPLEWPTIAAEVSTTADIAAEGAASAAGADLTFGTMTLGAYKYAATGTGNVPLKVSVELLQDAQFDIGAFVARKLGERIARKQAYDLVRGSGSGEPLGIMYGTDGDIATASGSVPTYAKLNDLVHALDPAYRTGASFLFNDTTLKVLEQITDATLGRPLFLGRDDSIADSISSGRLMGYPYVIDQSVANGANNVQFIGFGNWQEAYIVRHVRDVQVLVNPYGTVGYVQYDAWARMDGNVQQPAAYVTMEGTT
jgi:HK97 family phage major capsid protein/HK97 family phage prohead protease